MQNAISRVEKYLEERHPNVENPLESNKKVDKRKNISERKKREGAEYTNETNTEKERGEMSL